MSDADFAGSIPENYERYLVPLIFAPYAEDMAERAAALAPQAVLEIAAGTGVVTRALARALPASSIVASDLSQPMLDQAAAVGTARPVLWRQADASRLPFADASFDLIVCQFGVMFFPDKAQAFAEARRVLRPAGTFLFNVWDKVEENQFPATVMQLLGELFADDPPSFLTRTPHGHHDIAVLEYALREGGFRHIAASVKAVQARADSATAIARAFCLGSPLRGEIEERGDLLEVCEQIAAGLAERFGPGPIEGKIQAHILCAS